MIPASVCIHSSGMQNGCWRQLELCPCKTARLININLLGSCTQRETWTKSISVHILWSHLNGPQPYITSGVTNTVVLISIFLLDFIPFLAVPPLSPAAQWGVQVENKASHRQVPNSQPIHFWNSTETLHVSEIIQSELWGRWPRTQTQWHGEKGCPSAEPWKCGYEMDFDKNASVPAYLLWTVSLAAYILPNDSLELHWRLFLEKIYKASCLQP